VRTPALLLDRDLSVHVGERELADPARGEVRVRVEWAGVCGSDLHMLRTGEGVTGWPAVLGREVAGTVEASPGGEVPAGTRVVVGSGEASGTREAPGTAGVCGGFGGHVLVPAGRAAVCPEGLEAAVAVMAGPLAAAMHAVGRGPAEPGRVLILGYGPAGALIHLELTRRWPETVVSVAEPDAARRQLAGAFGAEPLETTSGIAQPDRPGIPQPDQPRLVVDAAGYPGSLGDALAGCARGGTVLVVNPAQQPVPVLPAGLAERELSLVGSAGFRGELPGALAALAAEPDRYRPLVTEAVLLDEAPGRLREMLAAPAAGAVLIGPVWA
jgi:2-desacetyl-2-hydroxyethyl bacteriochlorophyllide A dehydrogenase